MRTNDRQIQLTLRIDGAALAITVPQPPQHGRLDELLPALHAIDNAAIGHAVHKVEASGAAISCAKGCSACCRAQPVPVTPPEAFALLTLVVAMPPARRADVEARFAERTRRLKDAGLAEAFLERDPELTSHTARGLATAYFQLGLVCPFLEGDVCSIHPQRPFVCRQYLVTSDPALCADPFANPVAVIPMPLRAASAMLTVSESALGGQQHTVPLILALEYVRRHRDALSRQFDAEPLLRQWLQALTNSDPAAGT
ncbi:YkgJ family cysteine cluster protein [Thermomonas sp.]|uniref:YkgJ family cysteine cluster protein n=1 Tax=Thermomonas sp. TaxID=1971895 RepID=UPI002489A023|nr:YkgJ family cysteine cluster protein [Thermomonas sp.]MDI1254021.1 YkgJ family cysteine cluster protein [Thermomonas sp.]